MATISNTPRPGYVWDATDNCWYPIGTGPHSHADYITAGSAINPNIVDAKGDIIAATAADTVARLAVGSNDQVLTADSSTATGLKWATPAAGGMTLISTTSLTGSAVTLSSIPQTYIDLYLVFRNYECSVDGNNLVVTVNNDSGANRYANRGYTGGSANFANSYWYFGEPSDNTVNQGFCWLQIRDYTNTTTWKLAEAKALVNDQTTTTYYAFSTYNLLYNQTSAISRIDITPAGGTFTDGTVLLYGVK